MLYEMVWARHKTPLKDISPKHIATIFQIKDRKAGHPRNGSSQVLENTWLPIATTIRRASDRFGYCTVSRLERARGRQILII